MIISTKNWDDSFQLQFGAVSEWSDHADLHLLKLDLILTSQLYKYSHLEMLMEHKC